MGSMAHANGVVLLASQYCPGNRVEQQALVGADGVEQYPRWGIECGGDPQHMRLFNWPDKAAKSNISQGNWDADVFTRNLSLADRSLAIALCTRKSRNGFRF